MYPVKTDKRKRKITYSSNFISYHLYINMLAFLLSLLEIYACKTIKTAKTTVDYTTYTSGI